MLKHFSHFTDTLSFTVFGGVRSRCRWHGDEKRSW